MTTEELKKKIDGLFLGLHSTNPGDINAVKDILNALAENAEFVADSAETTPIDQSTLRKIVDAPVVFNSEYGKFFRMPALPDTLSTYFYGHWLPANSFINACFANSLIYNVSDGEPTSGSLFFVYSVEGQGSYYQIAEV